MKLSVALLLAPLAAMAAPTLDARAQGDEQKTVVKLDGLARGSSITVNDRDAMYVGQENSTDISLFQNNKDRRSVYSLVATQGEPLPPVSSRWPRRNSMGLKPNGLCEVCENDIGKTKRDLIQHEKRTLGLLFAFKKKLFNWCWWNKDRPSYPSGCLDGYNGNIWVGHGGGQQCSVGNHGYIHYPNIPSIGWDNGYGGKYCGSYNGVQYWWWQHSQTVCPINIKWGWQRPGCTVNGGHEEEPPICSTCHDNSGFWDQYTYPYGPTH